MYNRHTVPPESEPSSIPSSTDLAGSDIESVSIAAQARAGLPREKILRSLPYHRDLVTHLREAETEQWQWFSSTRFRDEYAKGVRLELLKSCYRFERADHADLYALADLVRVQLGLDVPVILYQSQSASGLNAFLSYVPGEAHVVFEGAVRDTLSAEELRATLAHELTHYLLWQHHDEELLVADQLLAAMANDPRAEPSHVESARLFRLYLEIHADRGALAVCEPLTAIAALIKVQTGLADAQAEAYLRQSDEIFSQHDVKAEELTHPESFIRARALQLWATEHEGAEAEIARMVEGPLDLGRLTLMGQKRLSGITRKLLARYLHAPWLRSEARLAHARLFFADLDPEQESESNGLQAQLGSATESTRQYLCYVLLDLVTVDRQDDDAPLAAALRVAEEFDAGDLFLKIAAEELELSKRATARLRKSAIEIVAAAAAAGPPESAAG